MREINEEVISNAIKSLFINANYELTDDVINCIECSKQKETNKTAKNVLSRLQDNLDTAKSMNIPICQDTGMAVLFAEIGMDVHINSNKSFQEIVDSAVADAYKDGYLRLSVVKDPLRRVNTENNAPAVCHTTIVQGNTIKLIAAPKGFGSENMSKIKMFTPTASVEDIINFVVETVKSAGSNPCPPIVVGVGIGGTFDYSAVLSKKALTRSLDKRNTDPFYADLEDRILSEINNLNIGPQGFGGDTTALKVNIESYPTHIAGLPVAVNINCHVCRHRECII